MAEHKVGNMVVLTGTIVEIEGNLAVVRVNRAVADRGTVTVRLGVLPDAPEPDEDLIRRLMGEAQAKAAVSGG